MPITDASAVTDGQIQAREGAGRKSPLSQPANLHALPFHMLHKALRLSTNAHTNHRSTI